MLTCSPLSTFSPIPQKVVKANSVTLNSDTSFQLREKQYRMMTVKITSTASSPMAAAPMPK